MGDTKGTVCLPSSMDPPVSQSICVPSLPPSQHGPTSQSVHLCALPPSLPAWTHQSVSPSVCHPFLPAWLPIRLYSGTCLPPLHWTGGCISQQPLLSSLFAQVIYLLQCTQISPSSVRCQLSYQGQCETQLMFFQARACLWTCEVVIHVWCNHTLPHDIY